MAPNYSIQTRILRLCKYFTDESSGDLIQGAEVRWRWDNYHAVLPVLVDKIVPNELIQLTLDSAIWNKTDSDAYDVKVVFEFQQTDDGSTMLSISEEGWKTDAAGLKASHE
jgi:uncharacterized protein YndB with AHSA1/START domain